MSREEFRVIACLWGIVGLIYCVLQIHGHWKLYKKSRRTGARR